MESTESSRVGAELGAAETVVKRFDDAVEVLPSSAPAAASRARDQIRTLHHRVSGLKAAHSPGGQPQRRPKAVIE